ncbi:RING-type domain-containing protein [Psidium guajava]|nr:RING-type domain-containing protein [Psidium guajava]
MYRLPPLQLPLDLETVSPRFSSDHHLKKPGPKAAAPKQRQPARPVPPVPQPRLGLLRHAQPANHTIPQEGSGGDEAKHRHRVRGLLGIVRRSGLVEAFAVLRSLVPCRLHRHLVSAPHELSAVQGSSGVPFELQIESVVSGRNLIGTLDREAFVNERASQNHHQSLRPQILENSAMARKELVNPTPENEQNVMREAPPSCRSRERWDSVGEMKDGTAFEIDQKDGTSFYD